MRGSGVRRTETLFLYAPEYRTSNAEPGGLLPNFELLTASYCNREGASG